MACFWFSAENGNEIGHGRSHFMIYTLVRLTPRSFALELRWQKISDSWAERRSLADCPKQNVSLGLHHRLFREHSNTGSLGGKLEVSPSATVGRGYCSLSEQMTVTRRSHCRREENLAHGGCEGSEAAILVPKTPVKFCHGHPETLIWERKDYFWELVILRKQLVSWHQEVSINLTLCVSSKGHLS